MSSIGMVGLTAYFGAFEVSKLKKEHTVVVSGAAGYVISDSHSYTYVTQLISAVPSDRSLCRSLKTLSDAKRSSVSQEERKSAIGSNRSVRTSASTTRYVVFPSFDVYK